MQVKIKLGGDWRSVLRKAWSVRGMAATIILMTLAAVFGVIGSFTGNFVIALVFQTLAALASALSIFARLVVQEGLE